MHYSFDIILIIFCTNFDIEFTFHILFNTATTYFLGRSIQTFNSEMVLLSSFEEKGAERSPKGRQQNISDKRKHSA